MKLLQRVPVVVVVALISMGGSRNPKKSSSSKLYNNPSDPCSQNYWLIKDQPERSFNRKLSRGQEPICDFQIQRGWYRFESLAGNALPLTCPDRGYCSTHAPIWMKGSIPSSTDGVSDAVACISSGGKCCAEELPLRVRNCSTYLLYLLEPPPACASAYCVGQEIPCPAGLKSDTGFTPCHFPVDVISATISVGITTPPPPPPVANKNQKQQPKQQKPPAPEVMLFCDLSLQGVLQPETVLVEVEWFADGDGVQKELFPLLDPLKGALPHAKWSIGQTVTCSARARHKHINTFSHLIGSDPFHTGIELISESKITLYEGGPPSSVSFRFLVPFSCEEKTKDGECCVEMALHLQTFADESLCPDGTANEQVVLSDCRHKVCSSNWNETRSVSVWAKPDGFISKRKFEAELAIKVLESDAQMWKEAAGYTLPTVAITVHPDDVHESCVADAMITTFDSLRYPLQTDGVYVIYKHQRVATEVQVNYRACSYRKLCSCGVAIRFDDAMIAADICALGYLRFWTRTPDGQQANIGAFHPQMRIISIHDGRTFQVLLPTGTSVELGPYLTYIKITASSRDLGHTSGLCGTFDRNYGNEMVSTEGRSACGGASEGHVCEEFTSGWRISRRKSLFAGFFSSQTSEAARSDDLIPKCACSEDAPIPQEGDQQQQGQEKREADCSVSQCYDPRGRDITHEILGMGADKDYDLDIQPFLAPFGGAKIVPEGTEFGNTSKHWSDLDAQKYCDNYLMSSRTLKTCSDMLPFSPAPFGLCKTAVMQTQNPTWARVALNQMKLHCYGHLYRNSSLWFKQRSLASTTSSLINNICFNDCNNGYCSEGFCTCPDKFSGGDCSVPLSEAPRSINLENGGLCDVRNKPCKSVLIIGKNFAAFPHIVCQWELFKVKGENSTLSLTGNSRTEASLITYQTVICPVPKLDIHDASTQPFYLPGESFDKTRSFLHLSIHYPKSPPSPVMDLLLYDSLCWECTGTKNCAMKRNNDCLFHDSFTADPDFSSYKFDPLLPLLQSSSSFFQELSKPDKIYAHHHTSPVMSYDNCSHSKDPGPCKNDVIRYYYDSSEQRCRPFVYGGCKGNENNFLSERECNSACRHTKRRK